MARCGVYQVLCRSTGHRYIGSSEDIDARWLSHKADLRRGKHHNKALQYAWTLFGETDFELSLIESVKTEDLQTRELHYVIELKPEFNALQIPGKRSEGRKKKISTTLRLPEELFHQMQEFCRIFRISQTDLMEKSVLEYVEKHGYRPHYVLKVTKDCFVLSRIEPTTSAVLDVQIRNGTSPEALQERYRIKYQAPVELVIDEGADK